MIEDCNRDYFQTRDRVFDALSHCRHIQTQEIPLGFTKRFGVPAAGITV